jgi:hypothetical protein
MDFDSLSDVKFGDLDGLDEMLFANFVQHKTFREVFYSRGIQVPAYPLANADPANLDDWLLAHQVEHQAFASLLGLTNPFNILDDAWDKEEEFYNWLALHLTIHEQIAKELGLT